MVLLVGVAALALLGTRWNTQTQANAALQARLTRIQPPTLVKPTRSAAEQRELEAQAKVVSDAVRQLNLPVAELIKTLQAPKDIRVALISLDLNAKGGTSDDAGNAVGNAAGNAASNPAGNPAGNAVSNAAGGLLKISAEARTPQEMLSYVAFLDDKPLFKSVYLIKHELIATTAEPVYRFLLEVQWRQ